MFSELHANKFTCYDFHLGILEITHKLRSSNLNKLIMYYKDVREPLKLEPPKEPIGSDDLLLSFPYQFKDN